MSLEMIVTGDGSHSLLNTELNETYHSTHGALQESLHVFIKEGLQHFVELWKTTRLTVLEVGFGTGLNALLTLDWARRNSIAILYRSLESSPLPNDVLRNLNYPSLLSMDGGVEFFHQIHSAAWDQQVVIDPFFVLEKRLTRVEDLQPEPEFADVIFFDAFAPSKQPELWEMPVLGKMKTFLRPGGIFVTYCAKGQLKRDLRSLSFAVETLSGPPGKKEMVRGTLLPQSAVNQE